MSTPLQNPQKCRNSKVFLDKTKLHFKGSSIWLHFVKWWENKIQDFKLANHFKLWNLSEIETICVIWKSHYFIFEFECWNFIFEKNVELYFTSCSKMEKLDIGDDAHRASTLASVNFADGPSAMAHRAVCLNLRLNFLLMFWRCVQNKILMFSRRPFPKWATVCAKISMLRSLFKHNAKVKET